VNAFNPRTLRLGLMGSAILAMALSAYADEASDLAKKLSNPVAALISVPFQLNYDHDIGAKKDGSKWLLNVQPVVPITLNDEWNLISRTILPIVSQRDVTAEGSSQSGLGDIVQSVFFSPKAPTANGLIWGVGPVLLLPTGTDDKLSARKWGAGPTAVALKQDGRWTFGMLGNHIWSFAGDNDRRDVNATFLQPFVSYTTPDAWTYSANTESTYDWKSERWSVPLNASVSKLTRFGNQPVSLGAGLRYWASSPNGVGPEGLGFRLSMTFLFPK